MNPMKKLLTAQGLSDITGLALQTIYNRHANGGSLPRCINLGRRLRFDPDDILLWLQQHYERPSLVSVPPIENLPRRGRPTKAAQIAKRRRSQAA